MLLHCTLELVIERIAAVRESGWALDYMYRKSETGGEGVGGGGWRLLCSSEREEVACSAY